MRHAAEKDGFGLGALLRRLQGLLQQDGLLQFSPLFLLYVPKAQDHHAGINLPVVQGADIHPPVGFAKAALIISAVIGNAWEMRWRMLSREKLASKAWRVLGRTKALMLLSSVS